MPASAPEPRGSTFTRRRASPSRSWSRTRRPGVGGREVAEGDGLRGARVRVAGHDRVGARRRPAPPAPRTSAAVRRAQAVDRGADPEAQRGDRLLVAAAAEVGLARQVADDLAEARLHEAVDVLGVARSRYAGSACARAAPAPGRRRARAASAAGWRPQRPSARDVGARGRDLLAQQPPVEGERPVELPELAVRVRRCSCRPRASSLSSGSAR